MGAGALMKWGCPPARIGPGPTFVFCHRYLYLPSLICPDIFPSVQCATLVNTLSQGDSDLWSSGECVFSSLNCQIVYGVGLVRTKLGDGTCDWTLYFYISGGCVFSGYYIYDWDMKLDWADCDTLPAYTEPCCIAEIPGCDDLACLSVSEKTAICGWMSASAGPQNVQQTETQTCCEYSYSFDSDHQYTVELCVTNENDYIYYTIRITNTVYDVSCGNWGAAVIGSEFVNKVLPNLEMEFAGKTWKYRFFKTPVAGVDYPFPPVVLPDETVIVNGEMTLTQSTGCGFYGCVLPPDKNYMTATVTDLVLDRDLDTTWRTETTITLTYDGGSTDVQAIVIVTLYNAGGERWNPGCCYHPAFWNVQILIESTPWNPNQCLMGELESCPRCDILDDPLEQQAFCHFDPYDTGCISGLFVVRRNTPP